MNDFIKPVVVMSKCLGFEHCRYNGEIIMDDFTERLKPHVECRPVCPEMEIGLGTPRDPIHIISGAGERRLVQPASGRDVTREMNAFCDRFLDSVGDAHGFLLKFRSPSCGIKDVKIFSSHEKTGPMGKGAGFFGEAVLRKYPGLAVETEGRLRNFRIREHYLTRLFCAARWSGIKRDGTIRELVRFHTDNKLLLMAYNQKELKEMGSIVANPDKRPSVELVKEYQEHLEAALFKAPRYTSNINVLMHSLGYFSERLSAEEKAYFLDSLEKYRKGIIPLSVNIYIIRSWIIRFGQEYLGRQTFFQPYPEELMFISDSGKGRDL